MIHHGNALAVLRTLPRASVHCVVRIEAVQEELRQFCAAELAMRDLKPGRPVVLN